MRGSAQIYIDRPSDAICAKRRQIVPYYRCARIPSLQCGPHISHWTVTHRTLAGLNLDSLHAKIEFCSKGMNPFL